MYCVGSVCVLCGECMCTVWDLYNAAGQEALQLCGFYLPNRERKEFQVRDTVVLGYTILQCTQIL